MLDSKPAAQRNVTDQLIEQLIRHPKRVVFTEGEDIRVIEAAARLVAKEAVVPILLGRPERIRVLAGQNKIPLDFIKITDPAKSTDLPLFVKRAKNMARYRANGQVDTEETIIRPHYFGSMMIQYGHADAMVSGNQSIPAGLFRALLHNIKPASNVPRIFGVSIIASSHFELLGENGLLFLADTAMIPEPDVEQLASIAIETGKLAKHFLGRTPNIALLSHSTKGTASTKGAQKMAAATAMAKDIASRELLDFEIDGELQADVALDPSAAETKLPDSEKRHPADVLVFPNLDSAHISLKLLQHLAGAQNYGKLILGLSRPAAQIPRTANVETIFGTAAAVAVEAIKYHELHPGGDY
ncbi:phosphate acyltransferase [Luteolibacter sp. AS25]|uniref:phosphate acyltransferase n=1 Tax=Luteolibacter sp. AS25 TaxID=3135776 RepID=UPI00398B5C55